MINGKIFFALAAQKLGSDKALPFLALDPALGAGPRTVMSIKMLEEAEAQVAAATTAETRAVTAEKDIALLKQAAAEAEAARDAAVRDQDHLKEQLATATQALGDLQAKSEDVDADKPSPEKEILRKELSDEKIKTRDLENELKEVRQNHAAFMAEFEIQDRAFTAMAHQIAGPDATEDERAALEERFINVFARVPDEGPEALQDLMIEFLIDEGANKKVAEIEAKLDAHPALKEELITQHRALQKDYTERVNALFAAIEDELDKPTAPKKPRAPRKKKG